MQSIKRGFTLIELLVVIAIIAILAAILFPVFAQAKAAAKKTAAISNTKQIQLAGIQYMDDNDDHRIPRYNACGDAGSTETAHYGTNGQPGTDIWPNLLQPYVKNQGVFIDPAAILQQYAGTWDDRGAASIGINKTIEGWYKVGYTDPGCDVDTASGDVGIGQMTDPARWVMLGSSNPGDTDTGSGPFYRGYLFDNLGVDNSYDAADNIIGLSDRHTQGTVLGLFDGHAKWYKTVAILGAASDNVPCDPDDNFVTGQSRMDINGAHLKFNIQDQCHMNP